MEQIANHRGHVVYVRVPTSPPSYEAACRCGYRSERAPAQFTAVAAGQAHAEQAEPFHDKPAKNPAGKRKPRKTTRKTVRRRK